MKAARIHAFGPPSAIVIDDVPPPTASTGDVLVRVVASGVGPWDALIRAGTSVAQHALPFVLGADFAGVVESVGAGVKELSLGDDVFGVTNEIFFGAHAEYAVASTNVIAAKPKCLSFVEAASVPVVAVMAYQMLFDHAQVKAGQTVLVLGAGGNVGAYAVQLAKHANVRVVATAGPAELDDVRELGAERVVNYKTTNFEGVLPLVDAVIDTVGGEAQARAFGVVKPGGVLVSAITPPPVHPRVRSKFFLVDVTATRLAALATLFDQRMLRTSVGTVLPLGDVRRAHEMLAGAPHARGKIVLEIRARSVDHATGSNGD